MGVEEYENKIKFLEERKKAIKEELDAVEAQLKADKDSLDNVKKIHTTKKEKKEETKGG
jgi:chromosome segregation ATPase